MIVSFDSIAEEAVFCNYWMYTMIVKAYDEGYQIDSIYLDFKKAFNSVPHKRLFIKLKGYGLMAHYLSG